MYIPLVQMPNGTRFVQCADQWRTHLNMRHTAFLQHIGRVEDIGLQPARTEWGSLRKGRRKPSKSFTRLVLRKARDSDPVWADLLEAAYSRDGLAEVS